MPVKKKTRGPSKKKTVARKAAGGSSPVANVVAYAAEQAGVSQAAVARALVAAFAQIAAEVRAGNRVIIRNFGTFKLRKIVGATVTIPGTRRRMTYRGFNKVGFASSHRL